jgi:hypothetical protein
VTYTVLPTPILVKLAVRRCVHVKKEDEEMSSQVAVPDRKETVSPERQSKRKLLKVLGQLKTREVIDSQDICREARGKA